ncbi:TraM recognition domain-containing protein [Ferrimonas marina]|uniref:Intracellular multiplication protein IcmO n=1 Tax=Ferrimonas marina TaxID=299255 RepID=A0A1M5TC78_9GAMM|nr:TraM recognition domain-containing protein [Ferrimonas marina]SHH48291.1 intracellular multiplication protein IcmO [Ferrimonas marina]
MAESYHGVSVNEDLDPSLMWRDTAPVSVKAKRFFRDNDAFILMMCGFATIALGLLLPPENPLSLIADLGLAVAFVITLILRPKKTKYTFRSPRNPGAKPNDDDGILLWGTSLDDYTPLYSSTGDLTTHALVFGSTGSGKSRFLLGVLYQSMLFGSGCMMVDGKGDNTIWHLVYSICRRVGREDDLLLINYLIPENKGDTQEIRDLSRLSNTNQPFNSGTADELRTLIVGLMPDAGPDPMWQERASAMLKAVLSCLVYMRDRGDFNLDVRKIREYMPLDKCIELTQDKANVPDAVKYDMTKYLLDLPGYTEEDAFMGTLNAKAQESHGYLQMQLTGVLSDLSSTYKHIFDTPVGEVSFRDVVFNRRVLFVMLPALSRDPQALAGLGKLVISGIRSALAPALGSLAEGSKATVVDTKPTNSSVPFVLIMDEYGFYAVPGFSIVAAQARSLGVSCFWAGQDYPGFTRSSEIEAKSTVANTNFTVVMKLEDAEDTYQLVQKRAGEAQVEYASGKERSGTSSYRDRGTTDVRNVNRVNLRDLVRQRPGQAHILWKDYLIRAQLYYADPFLSTYMKPNKFVIVNKPTTDQLRELGEKRETYRKNLLSEENKAEGVEVSEGLKRLFGHYGLAMSRRMPSSSASQFAVAAGEVQRKLIDAGMAALVAKQERDKERLAKAAEEAKKPKPAEPESVAQMEESTASASVDGTSKPDLQSRAPVVESDRGVEDSGRGLGSTLKDVINDSINARIRSIGLNLSVEERARYTVDAILPDQEDLSGLAAELDTYPEASPERIADDELEALIAQIQADEDL